MFKFLNNFQTIIEHLLEPCLIIILGDFNVDILKKTHAKNKLKKKISWINSN
jgi:hypothetical protein